MWRLYGKYLTPNRAQKIKQSVSLRAPLDVGKIEGMKSHSPWWVVIFAIVAVLALLIFVSRRQAADYQSWADRAGAK